MNIKTILTLIILLTPLVLKASVLPPKSGYDDTTGGNLVDIIPRLNPPEKKEIFYYKIMKNLKIEQGIPTQDKPKQEFLIIEVYQDRVNITRLNNPGMWNTFNIVQTNPTYIKTKNGKTAMPAIQAVASNGKQTAILTLTKASAEIINMPNQSPNTNYMWCRRINPTHIKKVIQQRENNRLLEASKTRAIIIN